MSWSTWQKFGPTPPSGNVWSSVNPDLQTCVELRNAPDACARQIIAGMNPGQNIVKPQACVARGYTRQLFDPEVLQSSYMFQTQNINSPCNVQAPIYMFRYTP
jgi:hypothetical protein